MKSRFTTYFLIFTVIAIWGILGWKIFFKPISEEGSGNKIPNQTNVLQSNVKDSLWLDYLDPFLKNILLKDEVTHYEIVIPIPQEEATKVISHNIKYYGNIRKNNKKNGIVEIENEQYLLEEGSTEKGYSIIAIDDDSLRFVKDGVSATVFISQ